MSSYFLSFKIFSFICLEPSRANPTRADLRSGLIVIGSVCIHCFRKGSGIGQLCLIPIRISYLFCYFIKTGIYHHSMDRRAAAHFFHVCIPLNLLPKYFG
jgi:hypothetical protein